MCGYVFTNAQIDKLESVWGIYSFCCIGIFCYMGIFSTAVKDPFFSLLACLETEQKAGATSDRGWKRISSSRGVFMISEVLLSLQTFESVLTGEQRRVCSGQRPLSGSLVRCQRVFLQEKGL